MKFRRFVRQAHRWIGLLVAIQLVFWVLGGLVMSVLRLEEVRGDDRAAQRPVPALDPGVALLPPQAVLARHAGATALTLATLQDRPVYRVATGKSVVLVDAVSGAVLSPLSQQLAVAVARADYAGAADLAGVDWVDTEALEYRGRALPLWRVRFADDRDTALYVSAATGEVVARRNDLWRLFDFVWMFHIMDYEEREDFNHPLLVVAAATALLFVVTGLVMLVFSFAPRARAAAAAQGGGPSK